MRAHMCFPARRCRRSATAFGWDKNGEWPASQLSVSMPPTSLTSFSCMISGMQVSLVHSRYVEGMSRHAAYVNGDDHVLYIGWGKSQHLA